MKRTYAIIILVAIVALAAIGTAVYVIRQKITQSTFGLIVAGDTVNSESLVANLDSPDRDLIMTSLGILADRSDPSGRTKAIDLLKSDDNYIWFNAALYLGAIKEKEATPYLIKGLKHPASRSHDEVASLLESMTGQAFSKNQGQWIEWWESEHPGSKFIFSYPDLEQKAASLDDTSQILINGVVDPLRIKHVGPQVRLIGIRLKEDVDAKDAVALLHRLLAFQFVQLEFDTGPKLDEQGARRAFVYWTMSSPDFKMGRRGFPAVPFKAKTLINTYLLESGLYEIDLNTVEDEAMKQTLKQTAEKIGHNKPDAGDGK